MNKHISFGWILTGVAALGCVLVTAAGAARQGGYPVATVSGISPTQPVVGQVVTISGTNLDGTQSVMFGTVPAQSFAVDPNGTWVRAVVPQGLASGKVTVTLGIQGVPYSVGPITIGFGSVPAQNPQLPAPKQHGVAPGSVKVAPRVELVAPARGWAGRIVQIMGANFNHVVWVRFGGVRATFKMASKTMIVARVPLHARTGPITVHTAGGTGKSSLGFVVLATSGA
jgi:hypothetical protein